MTQTQNILDWLKQGKPITAIEALDNFGCFRLAARIADIRATGIDVKTATIQTRSGKSIPQYSLADCEAANDIS